MQINDRGRSHALVQQLRRRRSLRAGLTQLLYIAAGVGLGLLVPTLDTGARIPSVEVAALLAGITAGLLALTGIVFALLFLVVQFAATAQSPRLHLFRDRPLVWHALGLVIGVMVYATTCVVAQNPLGPGQRIWIEWLGTVTGGSEDRNLPQLIRLAHQADATFRLPLKPGDLVRENAVILEVWNPVTPPEQGRILKCFELGIDRTMDQDPMFGFRLLNDIALRAMSPAINDPATAVQTLDSIENLLTVLVGRDLAIGRIDDDTDTCRVVFDAYDWDDFLAAGTDEITESQMHPLVQRRLRLMLEQVRVIAPIERRPGVDRRIDALANAAT